MVKMEFKYMENTKYLILALIGMVMAGLGFFTYLFQPIELIIDSMTTLRPGTFIFDLWSEPPVDVHVKVFIFNVTNPDEFLAGKAKLRFEEIGPYVYKEILRNTNGKLNANGTMTFIPDREYIFEPGLSIGNDSDDYVIVPNVPLLGIGSMLSSYNAFVNLGFNMMVGDAEQFKNITVKDFMWGYEDKLVSLASTFIPSWIDFPTFGLLDRLSSRDRGNTVTMYLNEVNDDSNNTIYPYSINEFNGSPGLKQWEYVQVKENETSESNTKCNTIRGSYEGGLFPRYYKKNTPIRLYRDAFCRAVDLIYENETVSQDGFKIYNYRVDKDFLKSGNENPDNKCYCKNGKCMPNGFNTLAPCYYGIPIAISQPHFLNVDPDIFDSIQGMFPNPELHDTTARINPDMGIPITCDLRIQVNLHIEETRLISKVRPFSNSILPLCWLELSISEPRPYVKFLINLVVNVAPLAQSILMWLLGLFGISLIAVSALIVFYFPPQRSLEDPYHRIGYSPILVLPLSSRLKSETMRIS